MFTEVCIYRMPVLITNFLFVEYKGEGGGVDFFLNLNSNKILKNKVIKTLLMLYFPKQYSIFFPIIFIYKQDGIDFYLQVWIEYLHNGFRIE